MFLRQFVQYLLCLGFLATSNLALSNTEFTYNVIDGGIEVTGCVDECPSDLVISEKIDGYSVISIEGSAFYQIGLNALILPNTLQYIGERAFERNYLTTLAIPSSVIEIGRNAFDFNQLVEVIIPDGVFYIGESAFADNQLTTLTIPDSVEIIGDGAFDFNKLTSLTIPDSISYLGEYVFAENQLTTVTIPNSVTSIGDGAFSANQLTTLTIPGSVTSIGAEAFKNNQLTSIFLAEGIQIIEDKAFANNLLTSVSIPSSVFNLRRDAFSGNTGVIGGEWRYIERLGDAMLLGCADSCPSDMIIPEYIDGFHVQSIDDEAFSEEGLNSIRFPDGIVHIGQNAFLGNPLTGVTYCRSDNSDWGFGEVEGITPQLDDSCNISDEVNESVNYATFDIDQSGSVDALSDGLILLRYFFRLRGESLISGVISPNANRTSAADIEAYIESHMP
jgi:hypothetical protein